MPNKTERFTQRARQALESAEAIAGQLKHSQVAPHHLFLALLKDEGSAVYRLLADMGLDYESALEIVKKHSPTRPSLFGRSTSISKEMKQVLELSVEETRRLNHQYISTNHYLLALSREPEKVINRIFQHFGQDLQVVRQSILQIIEQSTEEEGEEAGIDAWKELSFHKGYRNEPFVVSTPRTYIVPLDENSHVLLAVEHAASDNQPILKFPSGLIRDDEDQAESANSEMYKKIGYKANRLDFLAKLDVQRKYAVWEIHAYLARELTLSKPQDAITIERVPLNDFEPLVQSGRLTDSTTIACLCLARHLLANS